MAKVVRFYGFGGPEVLRLDDCHVGEPGADEVRIHVGAFGLNRVEAVYRSGGVVVGRIVAEPMKINAHLKRPGFGNA